MRSEKTPTPCENPNVFTDMYENVIAPRLPDKGSLADRALTHTTGARPFFETVSEQLCEDGRIGDASARGALGFIARSATTGAVLTGTASLAALGLVVGSPVAAIGAGLLGLVILPPLAERAVHGLTRLGGDLLGQVRAR